MKKFRVQLLLLCAFYCAVRGLAFAVGNEDINGYVGSMRCKECHEREYRGWRSTLHPYKFQDATPKSVVGDFYENNILRSNGETIRMSRQGDRFFITCKGPDSKEHAYEVKYVIGEFWKQLYVTEFPNGELHILPAMWIVESREWKRTKYWPKKIYQFSCTGCHNTGSRLNYDEKTGRFRTTWADKGVACEACHGPGSSHVEAASRGGDPFGTIVNPARIPDSRRAAMVCGACHNRGRSRDGQFDYPAGYKPGELLDFLFDPRPKLHPGDTSKANRQQYIDWMKSGHAKAGVLCWDCHLVHAKGRANRYQTRLPGNRLCLSCHKVEPKGVHGIHSVNNCIGCHMPALGKRGTKGDVHSHLFKVILPEMSIRLGGVEKQPNSCNQCHYHENDDLENLQHIIDQAHHTYDSCPKGRAQRHAVNRAHFSCLFSCSRRSASFKLRPKAGHRVAQTPRIPDNAG